MQKGNPKYFIVKRKNMSMQGSTKWTYLVKQCLYAKATFKKMKLPCKSENTLKGNLRFILPGFYS